MTQNPLHADAETQAKRVVLANAVREDLAAAGLPVVAGDDERFQTAVSNGAKVYIDPFTDEDDGGVFVGWHSHYVVETAAVEAVMLGIAENDPTVEFSGKVAGAMQEAVARILVAVGYAVEKDVNEYAPSDLMVLGREPRESWRSWLSEQMDELQARAQSRRQGEAG